MDEENGLETIEDAETFLGGLRSELDEGSHLHPTFAAMSAAADAVRASYLSYGVTPTKAAEAFRLLRIVDDNDIEWTVGPSSGGWYRRRVGTNAWQPGPPPLMAEPKPGSVAPWLTSELADLLPSARTAASNEASAAGGSRAGIRVVDSADIPKVDESETRDWLLSEWDELEVHLEVLQQQARAQSPEPEPEPPVENFVSASPQPAADDLGLPVDAPEEKDALDMLSLFVPPEPRQDAMDLDDLLDRGPADRGGDVTAAAVQGDAPAAVTDPGNDPGAGPAHQERADLLAPDPESSTGDDPYGVGR